MITALERDGEIQLNQNIRYRPNMSAPLYCYSNIMALTIFTLPPLNTTKEKTKIPRRLAEDFCFKFIV